MWPASAISPPQPGWTRRGVDSDIERPNQAPPPSTRRAVEIASLTWGCIRESDTVIELIRTKGGKARSVPIP
jgi:hypothetical protein